MRRLFRRFPTRVAQTFLLVVLPWTAAAQEAHTGHEAPTPQAPREVSDLTPGGRSDDHSQHQAPSSGLPPFVPALTDEDRRAAFPDVGGHAVHGDGIQYFVLVDGLEWGTADEWRGWAVDGTGWIGRDSDWLWFRLDADGDRSDGNGTAQVFYGRQVSRWWDLLFGVRQDLGDGSSRTWAAVGVQGLSPYWFEVAATAYVSASGHVRARMQVEYELLLTNRVILQPQLEVELATRADPAAGIAAGLADAGAGVRLRYEFRREFAPYAGVTWHRRGRDGDLGAPGVRDDERRTALVAGLRFWF
jgi:copper resistance protein B